MTTSFQQEGLENDREEEKNKTLHSVSSRVNTSHSPQKQEQGLPEAQLTQNSANPAQICVTGIPVKWRDSGLASLLR